MYSIEGDTILDPFGGIGTTSLACIVSNRNSFSVDIDETIAKLSLDNIYIPINAANRIIENRIERHNSFIESLPEEKKNNCYDNNQMNIKVKTRQEIDIKFNKLKSILKDGTTIICEYE